MAPIFDSGSSLGYDKTASQIRSGRDVVCKPFKKTHAEQLQLASSLAWIDFAALAGGMDFVYQAMSSAQAKEIVGEERIDAIAETVCRRVQVVQQMSAEQQPSFAAHSTAGDVEKDIAEDYTMKMDL